MEQERKLLTKMALQRGGVLLVDDVLNEAKDVNSILHKHFEWNDDKAADQYRRDQARSLIQKCKITMIDASPVQIRAFVSLPSDRESGGGYRLTSDVVSDEFLKEELLRDIRLTISRWSMKLHLLDKDLATAVTEIELRLNSKQPDLELTI